MRWLAMLGDMGYTFLLWLNKWYNLMRARHGKTHYLNSGDWVESMTALVEDEQGAWWARAPLANYLIFFSARCSCRSIPLRVPTFCPLRKTSRSV